MESMIERDTTLQEIKEIWNRFDPNVDWNSFSPVDICVELLVQMPNLIIAVKNGVRLAISRGVFPGICQACPTDYKTQVSTPP